jgi:hypothetical protein
MTGRSDGSHEGGSVRGSNAARHHYTPELLCIQRDNGMPDLIRVLNCSAYIYMCHGQAPTSSAWCGGLRPDPAKNPERAGVYTIKERGVTCRSVVVTVALIRLRSRLAACGA